MADEKRKRDYDEISQDKNGKWQHLVEHCLDLYDAFRESEYRQAKIEEIKSSHKRYEQIKEQANKPWPGASNIVLPLTTITVDNLEPRLVAGLTGRKPYLSFELESDQKKDDQTELIETWFNDELEDVVKIEDEAIGIVHMLELEGTCYPIANYDVEEVIRRDFRFDQQGNIILDENHEPVIEDKVYPVFEGGQIEMIPFSDVFIADNVEKWEKEPVIRKVYPTYAELMRDFEAGKPGFMNIGTWLVREESEKSLGDEQQSPAQELENVKVVSSETIECIECSLSYIYQEEGQEKEDVKDLTEERIIVLIAVDKQVIIRWRLLRDINFKNEHLIKRIRLYPEKGKSYGASIYGKIKAIQDGANETFNLVINVADVTMMPYGFYEKGVGLSGDIILRPGTMVPVDSIKGILFPKFNINPNQFIDFIYLWTQFWEKLVSIGDLQVGRPKDEKKTTATEVMAVIQEGNVKHNYQSKTFREEFLGLLRTIYDLYYQRMAPDKTFLHNGKQVRIPRAAMARPFNFRLTGSTEQSNKLIERKENEDIYSLISQNPIGNPVKALEELLKSYGKTDTAEYIIDPRFKGLIDTLRQMPDLWQPVEKVVGETLAAAQALQGQGPNEGG